MVRGGHDIAEMCDDCTLHLRVLATLPIIYVYVTFIVCVACDVPPAFCTGVNHKELIFIMTIP